MTWRGWSPSALTIGLNEQANEVSFATDNADAAHEALRARGVDAAAEVLRLGEGVPAMFSSGIRTATATESSSEPERRGQAAALGRGGLPVVHSGHRTAAA